MVAGRSSLNKAMACTLNIKVERTTEVDNPVKIAYNHNVTIIKHIEYGWVEGMRFHKGIKSNSINP